MRYIPSLTNSEVASIKIQHVHHAVTVDEDYASNRIILLENWPEAYGDWAIVEGYHCSCYGYEDTKWEATVYTKDELRAVLEKWASSNSLSWEKELAKAWLTKN